MCSIVGSAPQFEPATECSMLRESPLKKITAPNAATKSSTVAADGRLRMAVNHGKHWRARQDSEPFATSGSESRRFPEDGRTRPPRICEVARPAGLEPATPGLEGRCSIQLSYGRVTC
jgi:hypothetical protein